jgi:hypothetical protein
MHRDQFGAVRNVARPDVGTIFGNAVHHVGLVSGWCVLVSCATVLLLRAPSMTAALTLPGASGRGFCGARPQASGEDQHVFSRGVSSMGPGCGGGTTDLKYSGSTKGCK